MMKSNGIKIHMHDFAGHPFQAELSNELAESGFTLVHSFFGHVGPTKALAKDVYGNGRIEFQKIALKQEYEVHNLPKRILFELKLAGKLLSIHYRFRPHVTIYANTPLIAATVFRFFVPNSNFILWHQDIFSKAIGMRFNSGTKDRRISQRLQIYVVEILERRLVRKSDQVICISDAFLSVYNKWSLDSNKVNVIENWAPLDQIQFFPKIRTTEGTLKLIYAGTLGLKHNPQLLIQLMDELEKVSVDGELMVISEGEGANFLKNRLGLNKSISTNGFVPLAALNQLLMKADLALMLLEEGASEFSVPSKTYSYLAAGKCIVAFAPKSNAASIAITKAGGFVFEPSSEGIHDAVKQICTLDSKVLSEKEIQARGFALKNFQISNKTDSFIKIIDKIFTNS